MNSSNASSALPPSPKPPDRDRFLLLLLQQSRDLLRSLPASLDESSARFEERLRAISKAESAEHANVLKACAEARDEAQASRATAERLIGLVLALNERLDASIQSATADRRDRERLEAKVDLLNSQLAALNEYAPR